MTKTTQTRARYLTLVSGLVMCLAASATAQGRVTGIIRDRAGDGIPGATVTADSPASRIERAVTSNDAGRFAFIGLDRGEWRFVVRADGFEPLQGFANVRRAGQATTIQFTLEPDRFNPPAPARGVLAGLKATELVESLEEAEDLFGRGEYDAAIDAYQSILERAPALTSVNLQIGHAFLGKQEPGQALAAYRAALAADPSSAEARAAVDSTSETVR